MLVTAILVIVTWGADFGVTGLSDAGEGNRAVDFPSTNLAFCCCVAAILHDSQAVQQQTVKLDSTVVDSQCLNAASTDLLLRLR